ncbi:MAG: hypothetical protein IPL55_15475 [Saprospiraceae bacterium]|nr:hypothetical protein [Saprospiraceae bacterium]
MKDLCQVWRNIRYNNHTIDCTPHYLKKGDRSGMQWSKHPTNKAGVATVYEA